VWTNYHTFNLCDFKISYLQVLKRGIITCQTKIYNFTVRTSGGGLPNHPAPPQVSHLYKEAYQCHKAAEDYLDSQLRAKTLWAKPLNLGGTLLRWSVINLNNNHERATVQLGSDNCHLCCGPPWPPLYWGLGNLDLGHMLFYKFV